MNILGVESATDLVGAAVRADDGRHATASMSGRRRHTESLAPSIAHVLEQAAMSLDELDVLAVDLGPGLFTGLRVGVSTVKGLAQGLGIGVIGLSSLDILARGAAGAGWSGRVIAIVDARRGELFVAQYRVAEDGSLSESTGAALVAPAQLCDELSQLDEPSLAVGDGALRYRELFEAIPGTEVAGSVLGAPSPAVLVDLALERLAAGAVPAQAHAVAPLYLRDADARINWVTRDAVVPA